ncbi:MAG: hypothetical protein LIP09_02740 [Bacteroidales bacterium]|nr:hypothetical protein [Bacteroidales bacterium]
MIDEVFYSYFIDIHKDNIDFKIIYKKQSDPVVQYKGDQVASAKAVPAHSTWLEQNRTS